MNLCGNSFVIRPVLPDEEEQILGVYRQCEDFLALGPVPTASIEMIRTDLALSHELGGMFCGIYRLADAGMLGIVDFVRAGWLGNPETAFLSLLMIASPYRARGFGAEVVRLVEADIIQSGLVRIIQSGVQVNNPNAIQFWLRMGYEIVSGAEDLPDGTTVFRLEKIIRRT